MMAAFTVLRPAPHDLVEPLFDRMSTADRTEMKLLASGEGAPTEVIHKALNSSDYTFCYTMGGEVPVAMGGVVHTSATAQCWMVASTPILFHHKKSFLRSSQAELDHIRQEVADGILRVGVDSRWRKSLKWLHWLGFVEVGMFSFKGREGVILEWRR